jgi:uncharacterized integral membrane protein
MSTNTPPGGSPYEPHRSAGDKLVDRLASPRAFFGILITIAAVWFIIANNTRVRIHLWLTWVTARMWLVLLLTFVAGVLVGLLSARRRRKARERGVR